MNSCHFVSHREDHGDDVELEGAFLLADHKNIARQVARGVLHCEMLQKSVAVLPVAALRECGPRCEKQFGAPQSDDIIYINGAGGFSKKNIFEFKVSEMVFPAF